MAEKKQKGKPASKQSTSNDSDPDTKKQVKLSPFTRNFKHTSDPDSPKYKVDDSKIWNGVTYYVYDFPTHKVKLKCHNNNEEACRTCKRFMESKHNTGTSPFESKFPAQENLAKKIHHPH